MSNPATALAVPVSSGIMEHSIHGVRPPKILKGKFQRNFPVTKTTGIAPVPHEQCTFSYFISKDIHSAPIMLAILALIPALAQAFEAPSTCVLNR